MRSTDFDLRAWTRDCEHMACDCRQRAMTPMHFTYILGQSIEDALDQVPQDQRTAAVTAARGYGYETPDERMEMQVWLLQRASNNAFARGTAT